MAAAAALPQYKPFNLCSDCLRVMSRRIEGIERWHEIDVSTLDRDLLERIHGAIQDLFSKKPYADIELAKYQISIVAAVPGAHSVKYRLGSTVYSRHSLEYKELVDGMITPYELDWGIFQEDLLAKHIIEKYNLDQILSICEQELIARE